MRPEDIVSDPWKKPPLEDALELLDEVESLLKGEPSLLELEGEKAVVVGDTHGDLPSSLRAWRLWKDSGGLLLFLGDYVDRGPYQVENVLFALSLKLLHPDRVFLLRGNHETPMTHPYYGFLYQAASAYSHDVYVRFCEVFAQLPYSAAFRGEYFLVHGGIAQGTRKPEDFASIPKGLVYVDSSHPVALQVLWNDPSEEVEEFAPSFRGPGIYYYGRRPFEEFMEAGGFSLFVRAHEAVPEGLRWSFGGRLVTVFSAARYGIPIAAKALLIGEDGPKPLDLSE